MATGSGLAEEQPSRRPAKYRQVEQDILAAIREQKYREGDRLPSEHELARQYQTSRITINTALASLARQGMLVREPGYGTFVKRRAPVAWTRLDAAINVCHFDDEFHAPALRAFENENPNTFVNTHTPQDGPLDVVKIQASHMFRAEDRYLPLDRMEGWPELASRRFPEALRPFVACGRPYGAPRRLDVLALYMNLDLFDEAGVAPPAQGCSWEMVRDLAAEVARAAPGRFGIAAVREVKHALPLIWQLGGDQYDEQRTRCLLDEPAAIEAIRLYQSLDRSGLMAGQPFGNADAMRVFVQGRAAMILSGGWMLPFLKRHATFRWQVAPLPAAGRKATLLQADAYAIPRTCRHVDMAWALV
ncbi:MAG TPA: extracellular solute-binding protein [Candidatus Brocadiia bacterium]|nr:extracellular solute-binding protein [Candidatus Brocadiia bacterium]